MSHIRWSCKLWTLLNNSSPLRFKDETYPQLGALRQSHFMTASILVLCPVGFATFIFSRHVNEIKSNKKPKQKALRPLNEKVPLPRLGCSSCDPPAKTSWGFGFMALWCKAESEFVLDTSEMKYEYNCHQTPKLLFVQGTVGRFQICWSAVSAEVSYVSVWWRNNRGKPTFSS